MLSGNPDTFAIWCDPVKSWSTGKFQNGCFGFFVGGKLIISTRSTIEVDLYRLSQLYCMNNAVEDSHFFNLASIDAYRILCERAFPSIDFTAEHSDFTHLVSAESLSDDGHYLFLVENMGHAKLVYGFRDDPQSVFEVSVGLGEFQSVVRDALTNSRNPNGNGTR